MFKKKICFPFDAMQKAYDYRKILAKIFRVRLKECDYRKI